MSSEHAGSPRQLGLPERGPGSPGSWGRRIVALIVDWGLANLVAFALTGRQTVWLPLVCWFALVALTTAYTGASPGQWLMGLRVVRLDRQPNGLVVAAVRTFLIALVLPPLVFTAEGRGLHDLAVRTVVVNGPGNRG